MQISFTHNKSVTSSIFMKQLLFLILLVTSSIGFSQAAEQKEFNDKYEEFDYYAKPNKKNELSRYIRNHINIELLNAIKFKKKDPEKHCIFLSFRLNSKNKPVGLKVNSPYSELNESIRDAFKKYDIEKLNIPEKDKLNTYVLQIISKEDNYSIVNCSTNIIYDRFPVFEGCESIVDYNRMRTCINNQLQSHIVKNISHAEIINSKVIGYIKLYPKFRIDKNGEIEQINSKAPTESLTKELNRIISIFPKAKTPPTRNGNPTSLFYNGYVGLQIDSKDGKYEDEVLKSNDSLLNPNNDLALHFKKYISEKEINNIKFYRNQKSVKIFFGIDKKGKLVEIKTNLRDIKMNSKIIQTFKKYPLEKLNITSSNILTLYSYNVITKIANKKIIECNDEPYTLISPVFNKRCEKSKTPGELKNCFNQNLANIIQRKFDKDIRHKTKLSGDIKIFTRFQVNELGEIVNVKVRAPNPFLANEIEEILNSIPTVLKPGYSNGKAAKSSFSLPIKFNVGFINTPEDPFKDLTKRQY